MEVIAIERDIQWLPLPNEAALVLGDALPPLPLITSALALAFDGQRLLMTNLQQRDWDIPGGHLEADETPEEAMRREVFEESGALLGDVRLLAYHHIRLLGAVPTGYRYPYPDSYQVLYLAQVLALHDFEATEETSARAFFRPDESMKLRWVIENKPVYEAALRIVRAEKWQSVFHES